MFTKLRSVCRILATLTVQPVDMFYCDDMGNRVAKGNRVAIRFRMGSGYVDAVHSADDPMQGFYRNIRECSRMSARYACQ